jgi:ABC-type polar amino acid transport system ATPase subunit
MLTVKHLSKSFGDLEVLKDVSLTFKAGSKTAIIGPSGSGKSTLLRCLNGLETPTQGEIYFNDILLGKDTLKEARKKMAMVFQGFELFSHMTVLDNVMYALKVVHKKSLKDAEEIAYEKLRQVGLLEKADVYPTFLSGGQKQRVAIARALATEPEVVLLDEPTSALDPEMVDEVLEVIKLLDTTNLTTIMVTHEVGFAKAMADTMVFMKEGQIVIESSTAAFFKKTQPDLKNFLGKIHH